MFPINTTMKGGCLATVPDVCKTPSPGGPVPVPYPNTGQWVQTIPVTAAKKTKIQNAPIVVANSPLIICDVERRRGWNRWRRQIANDQRAMHLRHLQPEIACRRPTRDLFRLYDAAKWHQQQHNGPLRHAAAKQGLCVRMTRGRRFVAS